VRVAAACRHDVTAACRHVADRTHAILHRADSSMPVSLIERRGRRETASRPRASAGRVLATGLLAPDAPARHEVQRAAVGRRPREIVVA
jgi:hypothetical protein